MRAHSLELLVVLAALGCGGDKPSRPVGTGASETVMVTAATGGTVTLEGTTLSIPAGALAADTAITITSSTATPPAAFKTWNSPVFKFEPDGLEFLTPVQITLAFTGSPTAPAVYWSKPGGGYEHRGGTVAGTSITTMILHFSEGFVAEAPGPDELDAGLVDGGVPADVAFPDGGTSGDGGFVPDAAPFDGGTGADGGFIPDAASFDGGTGADGGIIPDAPAFDAGTGWDAGSGWDAPFLPDAPMVDAGSGWDAPFLPDAPMVDAGSGWDAPGWDAPSLPDAPMVDAGSTPPDASPIDGGVSPDARR